MAYLISFPVLVTVMMVQLAIFSQLPLLSGTTDLILLVLIAWSLHEKSKNAWFWAFVGGGLVSIISAIPYGAPLLIYISITAVVRMGSRRIREFPVLGMLIATIGATFAQHLIEVVVLFIAGTQLPFNQSLVLVTLPSILLNLFFALPVYALVTNLARWIYPIEVQI
jgi:rod shape-determining protein MreD